MEQSFSATAREGTAGLRQGRGDWKCDDDHGESDLFRPSVLTCMGAPLRGGARNMDDGFTVSPDLELSVLAEL
jgi:hypothetical protein